MHTLVAVKLSKESLRFIMASMIDSQRSAFAHALLTSAYNGENWYFVTGNVRAPMSIDYTRQIMTEDRLKELCDFDHSSLNLTDEWFTVSWK